MNWDFNDQVPEPDNTGGPTLASCGNAGAARILKTLMKRGSDPRNNRHSSRWRSIAGPERLAIQQLGHREHGRLLQLTLKLVPVLAEFLAQLADPGRSQPETKSGVTRRFPDGQPHG